MSPSTYISELLELSETISFDVMSPPTYMPFPFYASTLPPMNIPSLFVDVILSSIYTPSSSATILPPTYIPLPLVD